MSAPAFANDPAVLGPTDREVVPGPLEAEVRRIYERSPLYGRRFALHADPLQWSCFREIPALSKKDIVENGHQAFFADYRVIERGLADKSFEYESTSGTTSGPMTVIMEEGWWNKQTERAYLASPILRQFVGRPYRKCVLAPIGCSSNLCPYEDHPFPHRYFDGTVYLNLTSDPFVFPEAEWDRIVRELQATQPEVIEGEPVYLSLLARATQKRGVKVPSVRAVILTYGKASLQHARRIAEVFPAPQVDLYGSTEAGYLFVGEAFKDNLRAVDANAFIELVRYHTGDIVERRADGFRILGREGSIYFRPDGSLVAASDVDEALPQSFRCWHYALIQTGETRWDFHYVSDETAAHREIETALGQLLGAGVRVNAFRRRFIAPAASGKFALLKPLAK